MDLNFPNYRAETSTTNPLDNHISTTDTIAKMIGLVNESAMDPSVHHAVADIIRKLNKALPTELDLIRATYWWIKNHIKFVQDEEIMLGPMGFSDLGTGKELLLSPPFILQMEYPMGDCDDFSTLLATLLMAEGFQKGQLFFCTVAADANMPDHFSHVYVKVKMMNGETISLDASHGSYPGWETEHRYSSVDWAI